MSILPTVSDVVNPQPGFYAVIPVKVLRCKDLPSSAKLMYGDISALCSVEGYCWAGNSYFASLYEVDDRTIRRWLAGLVRLGFIKLFVKGPNRRIYLAEAAPKQAKSRAKMSGLAGQKCPGKAGKNVHPSITCIKTNNNTSEDARGAPRFVSPGPVPARELAGVEQEEKGSASPSTLKANPESPGSPEGPALRAEGEGLAVREVVHAACACKDWSSLRRFQRIWDIVEGAGCADVWREGLDAVKTPMGRSTGILGPPASRFVAVVALGLAARGVSLPDGLTAPAL